MAYEINLYDNGKECAVQTPFYQSSTKKCIKCDNTSPLFNITTQKCVACGLNQTFKVETYLCEDKNSGGQVSSNKKTNLNAPNIWAQNYTDYKSKQNTAAGQQCPLNTPFSNGTACIGCNKT